MEQGGTLPAVIQQKKGYESMNIYHCQEPRGQVLRAAAVTTAATDMTADRITTAAAITTTAARLPRLPPRAACRVPAPWAPWDRQDPEARWDRRALPAAPP